MAYAVGFRPWERAGRDAAEQFGALLDREALERSTPLGRAVDLGCGTGAHTIGLAGRGWQAVGIDNQPRALRIARARAAEAGADATFIAADVTALAARDVGSAADFLLDVGCFHHLGAPQRRAMAAAVTAVAAPGATLLMLAFSPGRRGLLPPGASRDEIETAFGRWVVIADEAADTSGMPRALRGTAPRWYRLRLTRS
jgi:SAM-dependent methyltransferase